VHRGRAARVISSSSARRVAVWTPTARRVEREITRPSAPQAKLVKRISGLEEVFRPPAAASGLPSGGNDLY